MNQSKILLGSARSDPGDILQVHDIDGKPLEDITALDGLVTQSGSVFSAGGNFYTLPTNKIVKINGATGETTYNVARAHPVSCGDGTYLVGIEFFYSGLPLYNWVTVYFYSAVDGSYLGALESNHVLRSTTLIQRVAIVPSAGGFVVYVGLSGSKFQTGYCTYSGGWNPDPTGQSKVTWSGVLEPEACLETANYTVFIVHISLVGDYDVIYTAKGGVNSIRFLLSLGINIDHITTAFVILGTDTIVFNGCNGQPVLPSLPKPFTGSYKWDVGATSVTLLNANYLVVSPLPSVGGMPYALAVEKAPLGTSPHEWQYYVMNLTTGAVALFGKSLP